MTSSPAEASASALRRTPAGTRQQALLRDLTRGLDALDSSVKLLVQPLSAATRGAAPADGGWSVDQVLEHLCLTNANYLRVMRDALARAPASPHPGEWRPTLGGLLLVHALRSSWRLPAPGRIAPGPVARAQVLEAFLRSNQELRTLFADSGAQDWRQVRMTSPFARWLRLNLGDAALAVVVHGERHARQMERIVKRVAGSGR